MPKHTCNNYLRNASTDESSGEHFCRRITGITSGPVLLVGSKLEIIEEIVLTEKSNEVNSISVLDLKTGSETPSSLMLEFDAKILVISSALSLAMVSTSGPLNSGGIGVESLLSTGLNYSPEEVTLL